MQLPEVALRDGRSCIVAAWHGMTMMLVGHLITKANADHYLVVVPDDARGAVLTVWAHRLGATPFAISLKAESLVAARRLLTLIREAKRGKSVWFTPDGPYGPTHEPKGGLAFVAAKSGAPIVPAAAFTDHGYRIPRWDRYTVPFPFGRIIIVLGKPLTVAPDADLEQMGGEIRERMNEVEQRAEKLYRAGPPPSG